MKYTPHPFQGVAIRHAVNFLREAQQGAKILYSAPTGVGKSVVELEVQQQLDGAWIVTPRDEIIAGMLDKLGCEDADPLDYRISTPVKLRNRLMAGELQTPAYMIYDEGHHHEAETWQQLDLLTGMAPAVAYTATPYRGSPKSTRQFRERWGEPVPLITYEEAIAEGYISMPTMEVQPLVDDDVVDVSGGDFEITSMDGATVDRLGDMADIARTWYSGKWDRPTVFALPSTACRVRMQQELNSRGLPSVSVAGDTPRSERRRIFSLVEERILSLLHVDIVSEGVDLRLRRLVDLRPTLSPVRWAQQLGRIMRPVPPGEAPPSYVCTNRNIMRHAYVLEGAVSASVAAECERKFPPTQRAHARVLGLEAIGRFKPTAVRLRSGVVVGMYAMSAVINNVVAEFCVLVHPLLPPIWASKVNTVVDGEKRWGTWVACPAPEDLRGFGSMPGRELSEKQERWWKRSAASFGIDPEQEVNRKNFQALPVLADLGERLC